jgi:hypothetical protein
MGKELLLKAALMGGPRGAKTDTEKDCSVNLSHFCTKIARVYALTCQKFVGVDPVDVRTKAMELIRQADMIALYVKNGVVCDDEFITVMEALRWTGYYVTTGRKAKFNLALIHQHDAAPEGVGIYSAIIKVWNCFLLDDCTDNKYTDCEPVLGYPIEIIKRSEDSYEVLL